MPIKNGHCALSLSDQFIDLFDDDDDFEREEDDEDDDDESLVSSGPDDLPDSTTGDDGKARLVGPESESIVQDGSKGNSNGGACREVTSGDQSACTEASADLRHSRENVAQRSNP